ncbi:MAG: ABC transporter ATP-binding protein/permease, partial [Clostridiales bacterium]|nr:ABC transporter ATP-binding protein/permease [Clostridiales bacterium]
PSLVLVPMLSALVPKLMIDSITAQSSPGRLMLLVAGVSALIAGLSWISPFLAGKMDAAAQAARMNYRTMSFHKILHTDYENIESLEGRKKFERSKDFSYGGRYSASQDFFEMTVQFAVNLTGIVSYLAILSVLHPAMLSVIAATCFLEYLCMRYSLKRERVLIRTIHNAFTYFDYLFRKAMDVPGGKDIRIYGLQKWFLSIAAKATASYTRALGTFTRQFLRVTSLRALLSLIRDLVAYVYLVCCVLYQGMEISDFIFYFGLITGFSAWILGISLQVNFLQQAAEECGRYRAFLEMEERGSALKQTSPVFNGQTGYEIAFEHVSFSYQGAREPTLRDLNFRIQPGENIAIVGPNGAGKTTCIKLLCGFYQPSSGTIRINGVPTGTFSKDAYFRLFSTVFQDYCFLPMSVEKNVALCREDQIDPARLALALEQAGLREKIETLPDGAKSLMIRQVYDDAVQFSGGELQKLLLARALYQDEPILILDEPTAALDPISENAIYQQYHELTKGKTSFFISHRLSSTRFCDRILYISGGTVREAGTHEELMAKKGRYWSMYQMQSHYYEESAAAPQPAGRGDA